MAYSSFTLQKVMQDFGITVATADDLFGRIPPSPIGETARRTVEDNLQLALIIGNEKARSELIVAPVLADLWRQSGRRISLYSGVALDVDPEHGLNGVCDYLIGRSPQLPEMLTPPFFVVVEAKKDDILGSHGQCAAEMIAALRMNAQSGSGVETIHGCVTTGTNWKFLTLRGAHLDIDAAEYPLAQLDRIFGILMHMVGVTPQTTVAA